MDITYMLSLPHSLGDSPKFVKSPHCLAENRTKMLFFINILYVGSILCKRLVFGDIKMSYSIVMETILLS